MAHYKTLVEGWVAASVLLGGVVACSPNTDIAVPVDVPSQLIELDSGELPPPASIEELIESRDAIVVATIALPGVEEIDELPVPDDTPPPTDMPGYDTYLDNPVTDYIATCLLSLQGDISDTDEFILRTIGHESAIPTQYHTQNFGRPDDEVQYLLLLEHAPSTNLDDGYFLRNGAQDMIIVDESTVTYSDGTAVPYAVGMTGAEFIEATLEAIEES